MTSREEARRRIGAGLRYWFRSPPRRHGEVEYSREVSFLELFYDLVYVVLIAQIAHHLAEHVDWTGLADFVVVFGLIWLAWFNGTFWHELHSRPDGRSRMYIFTQMWLLALLAVFAGDATGDDGPAFAITYAILFTLFTWQWYQVQRIDDPSYHRTTSRYLAAMVTTVVAVVVSVFLAPTPRLWVWAVIVLVWAIGGLVWVTRDRTAGFGEAVTGSLVERFGLFTIIVLGEVVVGVVTGINDAEDLTPITVATGIVSLTIGFGLWWNYFDVLGRRVPGRYGGRLAAWMFAHLPLTMAITAGGAAMVSLVEHANDPRALAATSWLLTGSVAVMLIGVTLAALALPEDEFPAGFAGQIAPTLGLAAVAILVVGAVRPQPIVLVASVAALLFLTWFRFFMLFAILGGMPGLDRAEEPTPD